MKIWGLRSGMLLVLAVVMMAVSVLGVGLVEAMQGPVVMQASAPASDAGAFNAILALLIGLPVLFGTTLAVNKPRSYELGDRNELPVIAADILYEGGAIGLVDASGHIRPLVGGDRFIGFAESKADNAAAAAAAINARLIECGKIQLSVTGAVITDVGQPVYATDDDTFVFNPVGASFIGFVFRFVSAGVVIVDFDAPCYRDPWGAYSKREIISVNKTLDIEDNGKVFFVDTDAVIITMPVVATPVNCTIVNIGAFGGVAVNISPAAADKVQGPDLPGTDNKDLINTKATARRGDFARLVTGDANGPIVSELRGTWATEA